MADNSPIRVAVVTGGHGYDVPNFHQLFGSLEGIDATIQHIDDFASSTEQVRDGYDAVLFFVMLLETPTEEGQPWYRGKPRTALTHLGKAKQGIVVLHHAVVAYPEWDVWDRLVGIEGRHTDPERGFSFHNGETVPVTVADAEHPITHGLSDWEMVDETYVMPDAGADSRVLLTTEHAKSMKTLGWVRQHDNSRVFCLQSGHGPDTWAEVNFREVLRRGIAWSAGRM